LDLWDRLIPLIELTLNHLQPSQSDDSVVACPIAPGNLCVFP
jgi:hypothetical protein